MTDYAAVFSSVFIFSQELFSPEKLLVDYILYLFSRHTDTLVADVRVLLSLSTFTSYDRVAVFNLSLAYAGEVF